MMRIDVGFPGAEDEAAVLGRYGTIAAVAAASGDARCRRYRERSRSMRRANAPTRCTFLPSC